MGGGQLVHGVDHWQDRDAKMPCGNAIETVHVHYGPFLLFFFQLLQGY